MIKVLGLIILGLVIANIFGYLRGKILNKVKDTAMEKFDVKKLNAGMFRVTDKVCWIKDIVSIFNVRKLFIYVLIATIIYGVGVYKGKLGKPINVDLGYEKSFTLQLDGQTLHKPKNSSQLELLDEKGNRIKIISVGDVKELQKKLSPFGFQLKPIFVAGYGTGIDGIKGELGIGVSWLRYFQWRIDNFLTQKGLYLGVSYKLQKFENSAVGIAIGKGYEGDSRILGYWRWLF